jgi:hypothetical protein
MLSIENTSFDVTLETFQTNNPSYRLGLHFLLPDADVPLHCTNLIRKGSAVQLRSNSRIFGIITMKNTLKKTVHRFVFIPEFNTEQSHSTGYSTIKTLLTTPNFQAAPNIPSVPNFGRLKAYVQQSLNLIRKTDPVDNRITKLHSVAWDFDLLSKHGSVKVWTPYVCLVCRGDALVNNLKTSNLLDIQHFFMKEVMDICHSKNIQVSNFIQVSKMALENEQSRHAAYIYIANFFSALVHKHIKYMTDYAATGGERKDAIGINEFDNVLYSDCEDMAQASFDLMRVFRKVFPSSKEDVKNNVSTFCYHVSAWLNEATLGIMQGAIGATRGDKLGNHVWAVILPKETPPVFVEGTKGDFTPSLYQYIIRFWTRNSSGVYDYFFINPDTGQYGMPANFFLSTHQPIKTMDTWSLKLNTTPIYRDLLFAANIQVDTFDILNYLINQ